MPIAIFGISGGGLGLFINLLVLFLIIVYFALIYWVYLDARKRIEDPVLIACATAAAIFPFVGPIIYTILRPPEFLEDVAERDLEIRAAELRLRQLIEQSCPRCEYPIERSYLRCPNCERRLKSPCRNCRKPLDPKWGVCPYCEAEVPKPKQQAQPGREQRRERRPDRERQGARSGGSSRSERQSGGDRAPERERPRAGGERSASERPAPSADGGRSGEETRPFEVEDRPKSRPGS